MPGEQRQCQKECQRQQEEKLGLSQSGAADGRLEKRKRLAALLAPGGARVGGLDGLCKNRIPPKMAGVSLL